MMQHLKKAAKIVAKDPNRVLYVTDIPSHEGNHIFGRFPEDGLVMPASLEYEVWQVYYMDESELVSPPPFDIRLRKNVWAGEMC